MQAGNAYRCVPSVDTCAPYFLSHLCYTIFSAFEHLQYRGWSLTRENRRCHLKTVSFARNNSFVMVKYYVVRNDIVGVSE